MTWIILQFLFLMLPVALPLVLYKSRHRFMAKFHVAMVRSAKARRLYTQRVLVLLLLCHYVFPNGHIGEVGVVLSTIVCAVMFSSKRVDKWLRYLLDRPRAFAVYALVAVVIGFVPHLYTMAVTIAFILLAALFYPSSKSLSEPEDGNEGVGRTKHAETSANSYSDNHHAGLPR